MNQSYSDVEGHIAFHYRYHISLVFAICSVIKGHFVLIYMKSDYISNIRSVHAYPKRLRLRWSVSPFFIREHKPTLVMSRARLGIRQNTEIALRDVWGAARAARGYTGAAEPAITLAPYDYTYADSDLQCVTKRARKRWCGADEAHA